MSIDRSTVESVLGKKIREDFAILFYYTVFLTDANGYRIFGDKIISVRLFETKTEAQQFDTVRESMRLGANSYAIKRLI